MTADKRGLYGKFIVTRRDGSSEPGGKHNKCNYFVLDLDHDKFAIPALRAYAKSCRKEHPQLSDDLLSLVEGNPLMPVTQGRTDATMSKPDWLDDIEAQIDSTVPYYVPQLIAEIRRLMPPARENCYQCDGEGMVGIHNCPRCQGGGKEPDSITMLLAKWRAAVREYQLSDVKSPALAARAVALHDCAEELEQVNAARSGTPR